MGWLQIDWYGRWQKYNQVWTRARAETPPQQLKGDRAIVGDNGIPPHDQFCRPTKPWAHWENVWGSLVPSAGKVRNTGSYNWV